MAFEFTINDDLGAEGRLLLIKRSNDRVYHEFATQTQADGNTIFSFPQKLRLKKGAYNIVIEVDGKRRRVGKDLYGQLESHDARVLKRGKVGKHFVTLYLTYPGSGLAVLVDDNKKRHKISGIIPPTLKSIERDQDCLIIKGVVQFKNDIAEDEQALYLELRPRYWGKPFHVSVNYQCLHNEADYLKGTSGLFGFEGVIDLRHAYNAGAFVDRFVDVFLCVKKWDGRIYKRKLHDSAKKFAWESGEDIFVFSNIARKKDIYAYFTRSEYRGLSLIYRDHREADSRWNRFKERLVERLIPRISWGKNTWLLFEHECLTAQDNGFVFFEWLKKNRPDVDAKYILNKKTIEYRNLTDKRGVIPYYSFRHLILLFNAKVLVSSQSRYHAYKFRPLESAIKSSLLEKPMFFLQHGVTAFKKNNSFNRTKFVDAADYVFVTSELEKEIVEQHWEYPSDKVLMTGFPRFDRLKDQTVEDKTHVLVMPTWRSWVEAESKEEFKKSEFFKHYARLIKWLSEDWSLDGPDRKVTVYLHSRISQYVDVFDELPNVNYIEMGEIPVRQMIASADIMVTDYSSVSWDFAYLGKPVFFYQFDYEKYEVVHGSYVDMESLPFGARAETFEKMQALFRRYPNHLPSQAQSQLFAYNDQRNNLRVYEAIQEKLS
ncbi:CDP-glycerol glycerophosphotransferase family protein [Salinicola halophyticus]|uniref:CDP-glycerol glycerophosphotransferase family protein n=1 Tax=Salinicola halophyticus TaxID=1808881 RepID=UPI003F44CE57